MFLAAKRAMAQILEAKSDNLAPSTKRPHPRREHLVPLLDENGANREKVTKLFLTLFKRDGINCGAIRVGQDILLEDISI